MAAQSTFGSKLVEYLYNTSEADPKLMIRFKDNSQESAKIDSQDVIVITTADDEDRKVISRCSDPSAYVVKHLIKDEPEDPDKIGTVDVKCQLSVCTGLPQPFVDRNMLGPAFPYISTGAGTERGIIYLVISNGSGTSQADEFFDKVIQSAFYSAIEPCYIIKPVFTEDERSITILAEAVLNQANEGSPQLILLLSGDGGIVDILNVLSSSKRHPTYRKPVLGLVAMGTGNALANSTGLNRDRTRGLHQFFRGRPYPLPSFTATFSPGSRLLTNEGQVSTPIPRNSAGNGVLCGAVVCSWGLHASLVAESDTTAYRKYGSERFSMAAKELLAPAEGSAPHVYTGKITLLKRDGDDDTTDEFRSVVMDTHAHEYILATLVSNLEEKLTISPHSTPLDGQLRLVHFGPMPSPDVMSIMAGAFQGGKHVDDERVRYEVIEGMRIDFEDEDEGKGVEEGEIGGRWRRVCVDGKIVRVPRGGWLEVRMNRGDSVVDLVADLE